MSVTPEEIARLRALHAKWRGGHVLHMDHPAVREFTAFIEHGLPALLDEIERLGVVADNTECERIGQQQRAAKAESELARMTALTGRELDERVARIFGWRQAHLATEDDPSWSHPKDPRVFLERPPEFSTDPGTLDEKLAWLRSRWPAQTLHESVVVIEMQSIAVRVCVWMRGKDWKPPKTVSVKPVVSYGATIHEATALLVVRVAETLGEAPKETT